MPSWFQIKGALPSQAPKVKTVTGPPQPSGRQTQIQIVSCFQPKEVSPLQNPHCPSPPKTQESPPLAPSSLGPRSPDPQPLPPQTLESRLSAPVKIPSIFFYLQIPKEQTQNGISTHFYSLLQKAPQASHTLGSSFRGSPPQWTPVPPSLCRNVGNSA